MSEFQHSFENYESANSRCGRSFWQAADLSEIYVVPATPDEMERLVSAFEAAHPPLARALADLLIRGKAILEDHRVSDESLIADFEGLLAKLSVQHGISEDVLSAAVAALRRIHVTVEQLERLP